MILLIKKGHGIEKGIVVRLLEEIDYICLFPLPCCTWICKFIKLMVKLLNQGSDIKGGPEHKQVRPA